MLAARPIIHPTDGGPAVDEEEPLEPAASGARRTALLAAFLGIGALIGTDLILDRFEGAKPSHVAVEAMAMVLALAAAGLLIAERAAARRALDVARDRADRAAGEAARWRAEAEAHLLGLRAEIDRQLDRWTLTDAEKEVALLLLKGLGTKEIAVARATSDRTVRQQAQSIYRKAGVAGRAELAAFFLEDLLLPPGADAPSARTAPPG